MEKVVVWGVTAWSAALFFGFALAQSGIVTISSPGPTKFRFMSVKVVDHDALSHEKFFIGPLPQVGDAVEMILSDVDSDGTMNFQLRVKR